MAATNLEVWQKGTIVSIENLSPTIRHIHLSQSMPAKAEPGSHIDLWIDSGQQTLRRSYSVVSQSQDLKTVTIAVLKTRNSRGGSEAMHRLEVGHELDITQPIQNFPLRFGAESYLLLAGGIGVTALVEMAEALKKAKANYHFVYVVKSRVVAAFAEQLALSHGSRFTLMVDDEENSLVVRDLIAKQSDSTELYMCGPIRLMDEVRREWVGRGFDISNLRFETFGASGWFEPEEFSVKLADGGPTVKVGKNETILDALESAGLEVMSDCKKGECGLCEIRVQSVSGQIDHRDVFYSEEQKKAGEKIVSCVSRISGTDGKSEVVLALD